MNEGELQKTVWKQMLESAFTFVSQANDVDRWAREFLGIKLYSNEIEVVKAVIDLKQSYNVIIGSRGCGKTFSTCIGLIKLCIENSCLEVGVFGPRSDQATRIITETKKILANSKIKNKVDWDHTTAERLVFLNSSTMLALSAAESTQVEGWHFDLICLDEAHRTSGEVLRQRILPMIGSKKIYKLIKIGIPLFKNHFFQSYADPKYKVIEHDWLHSPILLESGITEIDGKQYPTKVLDRIPRSLKTKMFPNNPELHTDGDMSEIEFNTQYGMMWMDDVNTFLSAADLEKLVDSKHKILKRSGAGEDYFFGCDTASNTLMPGKYDLDFTALSIWRKTGNNIKEKIGVYEWQSGESLAQIEDIIKIVHPSYGLFPCSFGLVDYSNVGITAVEALKRAKVPCAGIMFSATEPSSHKNYKNAMAAQFKFELQAGRIKYPSMEEIESNQLFRKHYYQWVALENHMGLGLNEKISAPEGAHDDGCFVGETVIPLLDGREFTLEQLSAMSLDNLYTYSIDILTKKIVPGKIFKAWKTGTKETVSITLGTGEVLKCTPDHLIMLRDGSYREAQNLKKGDSLMPLYKKVTSQNSSWSNYELIKDPFTNCWVGTHLLVARGGKILDNKVVHHKNFNSRNNNPNNLEVMTQSDHVYIHNNFWKKLTFEERKKRTSPGIIAACLRNKEHWEKYKLGSWEFFTKKLKLFPKLKKLILLNHTVVGIEKGSLRDVYDLTVEKYHNFAIKQGIFVHNCWSDALAVYAADRNTVFKTGLPTIHIPSTTMSRSIYSPRPNGINTQGKRFLT